MFLSKTYVFVVEKLTQVPGMTRVVPKAGRGGRAVKGENFAVNEPGREPFYVHAYHSGNSQQCVDLQASGPTAPQHP